MPPEPNAPKGHLLTVAVHFPGARLPLSLTVTSDNDGAAFVGSVWTLRSDTGAWVCQHSGPPLATPLATPPDTPSGLLRAQALLRQMLDTVFPQLAPAAFPLPTGASVRGFYVTEGEAAAERDRLLRRSKRQALLSFLPLRRGLSRPGASGKAVQQLLVDGSVVDDPKAALETLKSATPHLVSLSTAALVTVRCSQTHGEGASTIRWVPSARSTKDAAQLLGAQHTASASEVSQQPQEPPVSTRRQTDADALLDALPVFSVSSMAVGLPGANGRRVLFRPWFLDRRGLDAVLAQAHKAHLGHIMQARKASRRGNAVATARAAAILRAVAFGEELPPMDDGGGGAVPPRGGDAGGEDDTGDSLEDGGIDDTDSLVKDYMKDLMGGGGGPGAAPRGPFGDMGPDGDEEDGASQAPPSGGQPSGGPLAKVLFPWLSLPSGGGGHAPGVRLEPPTPAHAAAAASVGTALGFAAVSMALAAPLGDSIDALLARTKPGRRLLLTGRWGALPGGGATIEEVFSAADISVSTWRDVRANAATALHAARQKQRRGMRPIGGGEEPSSAKENDAADPGGRLTAASGGNGDASAVDEDDDNEEEEEDNPLLAGFGEGGHGSRAPPPTPEEMDQVERPLFVGDLGGMFSTRR